jgi:hypothetical protein
VIPKDKIEMSKGYIPIVNTIYEVNTDYHPFNLDNNLLPGEWPTALILDLTDTDVMIEWKTGDRSGTQEWMALIYFQVEVPMLIPALGLCA